MASELLIYCSLQSPPACTFSCRVEGREGLGVGWCLPLERTWYVCVFNKVPMPPVLVVGEKSLIFVKNKKKQASQLVIEANTS